MTAIPQAAFLPFFFFFFPPLEVSGLLVLSILLVQKFNSLWFSWNKSLLLCGNHVEKQVLPHAICFAFIVHFKFLLLLCFGYIYLPLCTWQIL